MPSWLGLPCFWNTDEGASVDHCRHHEHMTTTPGSGIRRSVSASPPWTRGNAADVFPEPFSPLGKSMVLQEALSPGLRDAYIDLGALSYDEFENPDAPDLFKMFGGYVYNPLDVDPHPGRPHARASPEMIDKAFFDERDEVPPYEEQPWHVSPFHEARLGESMAWAMSTQSLPELDADRALARSLREHRPDLAALTDSALLARARSMIPYLQQTMENAMRVSSLSDRSAPVRSARSARASATRPGRSACWPASTSTRLRHPRDVGTGPRGRASAVRSPPVRRRPRRGARPAPRSDSIRTPKTSWPASTSSCRPRRARPERVRLYADLVGGQAAHRARGHRPHAPLRRVAVPDAPQRHRDRRARSDRRPTSGRRSPATPRRPACSRRR